MTLLRDFCELLLVLASVRLFILACQVWVTP